MDHFHNEATFKPIQGALKDVRIKQIATSADCCLALSGINLSIIINITLLEKYFTISDWLIPRLILHNHTIIDVNHTDVIGVYIGTIQTLTSYTTTKVKKNGERIRSGVLIK